MNHPEHKQGLKSRENLAGGEDGEKMIQDDSLFFALVGVEVALAVTAMAICFWLACIACEL